MPDESPPIVDYKADGSVRLLVQPKPIRLSRPTVGRLRQLREAMVSTADEQSDLADDHNAGLAERAEAAGEDLDGEISKAFKRTERDLTRDLNRQFEAMWFAIGRDLVKDLGGTATLPDDDMELDPAFGSVSLYAGLVRHWQSVPFPSGQSGV